MPITFSAQNAKDVKSIDRVIDDNPAPLAAHIAFGPAGDPQSLKLRVRVNQYTYMHAVEATNDGEAFETHRFVGIGIDAAIKTVAATGRGEWKPFDACNLQYRRGLQELEWE